MTNPLKTKPPAFERGGPEKEFLCTPYLTSPPLQRNAALIH
jgi:hypothetical protein